MASNTKARPVHEVRMGRVKAAIWEMKLRMVPGTMSR